MKELPPSLHIKTMGNFLVTRANGSELRFPERRGQALIAILSVSHKGRRSRDWLKATLWPRSPEPQCSNSLRQTLHGIRRTLADDANVLASDRNHVWLESVQVDFEKPTADAIFYEDAPILDEPFEDWLRQQRANVEATCKEGPRTRRTTRLCLGIAPPIAKGRRAGFDGIANLICDQIIDSLRFHEIVDVFDLRDLATNQLAHFSTHAPPSIEFLARLSLVEVGGGQQVSFQVQDAQSQKVIWSMSIQGAVESAFCLDIVQLTDFTAQVVDAIHNAIARISEPSRYGRMLAAVHQLISHSAEGQKAARKILTNAQSASGLSHAWAAYTFAVVHGERHRVLEPQDFEEAEFHCRKAVELDTSNPLARALIAHVKAFVLQDYIGADEHLDVARRCGSYLAMTWRSSALHAHYTGNIEQAQICSARSHRLGQFSPYAGVYSTCYLYASATAGRHREAIAIGESILTKRPGYLAAMRHLSACYALSGHESKARALISDIRAVDPSFTPKGIRDPRYPLPSDRSLDLISEGFAVLSVVN